MDFEKLFDFLDRRRDPLVCLVWVLFATWMLAEFMGVLSPFLIAFTLAYVLAPVVDWMSNLGWRGRKLSRMFCVLTLFILVFAVIVIFGIPLLVNLITGLVNLASGLETADLDSKAAYWIEHYRELLDSPWIPDSIRSEIKDLISDPKELNGMVLTVFEKGRGILATLLKKGAGFLGIFFTAGIQFALVPILLFYFLLEFNEMRGNFLTIIPHTYHPWTEKFLNKVDKSLGGFVRGQLLIAFLFGVVMTFGLVVIGIPYSIILGPLAGLANLVPYLGVVVGLVPAFFLAIWKGGISVATIGMCLAILVLFAFLQALDGYVFQPRILGPSVELHPLWIMIALALGENLMGLAGMMLAVPVAAILKVILEELYPVVYCTHHGLIETPTSVPEEDPSC